MYNFEVFKELVLQKENSQRNFSIRKLFITANNQEFGGRFHSFAAKNPYRSCSMLVLRYSQTYGQIQDFNALHVSLPFLRN